MIVQEVVQGVNQQNAQQASQQISEQISESINKSLDRLSGQAQSQDQTSVSTTNRTVDQQIEDVHGDASLKANVVYDQANFARNKKVDGDLFVATNYAAVWQKLFELSAVNAQTIAQLANTTRQHINASQNDHRGNNNALTIDQKTLDVQDSATPAI